MRRIVIAAVMAFAAGLGGCDRNRQVDQTPGERPSTVVEPETRVDTVPQEEPAVARLQWRAADDDAQRAVTGNLR
ncbi:MAG: hypothetical protein R3C25_01290 [Hyphomonadaceae bacterium]